MDSDKRSNILIALGLILIILDWTLLLWFPFMFSTTFLGLCLLCTGISSKNRAKRMEKRRWNYSERQENRQANIRPQYQRNQNIRRENVIETTYEEEVSSTKPNESHQFCPLCGARARGKYCPECGSKIDY
ncbi:MAG: hypothetical protein R6U96_07060 [Promethearchaeia archaeon]